MQKTEVAQFVTKDMVIADVLKKHPDSAVIMLEHGLHCVGCHANVFDTIEAGSSLHGLDDEAIDKMIAEINSFISSQESKPGSASSDCKLSLTDFAAKKARELMAKDRLEGYGLRIAVIPGGCSGYVYQLGFENSARKSDAVLDSNGVRIFVDKSSLEMLDGCEIDYVEGLSESGFKFRNPGAKSSCGCGKSFG